MSDRPIIFSAPMILALLAGRKWQARRIIKPQPELQENGRWHIRGCGGGLLNVAQQDITDHLPDYVPYAVGDRLWVREACRAEELSRPQRSRPATRLEQQRLGRTTLIECDELDGADGVRYLADDAWLKIENTPAAGDAWSAMFYYRGCGKDCCGNPVPPIHMPRWASRLTLDVTDVRIQRLQDISEEDAVAEGVHVQRLAEWAAQGVYVGAGERPILMSVDDPSVTYEAFPGADCSWNRSSQAFADLWCRIHGGAAWAENPWVAALTFTVHHGNIDAPSPTPQVRRGGDRAGVA